MSGTARAKCARSGTKAVPIISMPAAEAAYARSDLIEKRKEMMEQWAEYLKH